MPVSPGDRVVLLAVRFNPALDVTVIGVSIDPPTSLAEGLSPLVAASVGEAAERVQALLPHSS